MPSGGNRAVFESVVSIRKVVRTCSNPEVARAALLSIGGEFVRRVSQEAARCGLSCGVYAARTVLDFEQISDLRAWVRAEQETRGTDQPILAGLRHVLDCSLRRGIAQGGCHETVEAMSAKKTSFRTEHLQ